MNQTITVLYASQMGAAQELAGRAADDLTAAGLNSLDVDLGEYQIEQLAEETKVLIIASTWGEGEPPDEAEEFYQAFKETEDLDLGHIQYAVMALGDSSYEHFCQFGKQLDELFAKHGAIRMRPCVECDLDEQERYPNWIREMAVMFKSRLNAADFDLDVFEEPEEEGVGI